MLAVTAFTLSIVLLLAFVAVSVIIFLKHKDMTADIINLDNKVDVNDKEVDQEFGELKNNVYTKMLGVGDTKITTHAETNGLAFSQSNLDAVIIVQKGLMASNLAVPGESAFFGNVYAMGNLLSYSNIATTGNLKVQQSIEAGSAAFEGRISAKDAAIQGAFSANDASLSNLRVDKASLNTLNVSGPASFENVSGTQGSFTGLSVRGIGTLSNLNVTESARAANIIGNVATFSNAHFKRLTGESLNVGYSSSNITSWINSGGDASLGRNLTVGLDTTVQRNMFIAQDLTVSRDQKVKQNAFIDRDLTVTQDANIKRDLKVAKDAAINRNLTVGNTLSIKNGVTVRDNDPGPFVEKRYGANLGDRYGVGQFPNGTTRMYAADTLPSSSVNLAFARSDGNFTDVLRVDKTGTKVLQGDFCVQDKCLSKQQIDTLTKLAAMNSNL